MSLKAVSSVAQSFNNYFLSVLFSESSPKRVISSPPSKHGARCRSMVQHLLMMLLVIGSIPHGEPIELFFSNQYSITGVTKAAVCGILSVGWCI